METKPEHPDTVRVRRMELTLQQRDARIRSLEQALLLGSLRCPVCGTMVATA